MALQSQNPVNRPVARPAPSARSISRIIGEGEMADLIRGFHWESTSLGPMKDWSDTLVTTINMLLASRHPMFLWWGPDLIQFYNDGYRPALRADKHPSAVGQRGIECWSEIWPIIGPQIESVMADGRSTWHTNQLVPINRDGKLEEVFWTYSYSPVRDSMGAVQGTLVVCSETTDQVLGDRRLKTMLALTASERAGSAASQNQTLPSFAQEIVGTLECNPADIPFAFLYHVNGNEIGCLGATVSTIETIDPYLPSLLALAASQQPTLVDDLPSLMGGVFGKSRPEPITQAYVLPLAMQGSSFRIVLIFGISPILPFGGSYQAFLGLVGNRIAALLNSRMQRLEVLRAAERFKALAGADPFGMVIGTMDGSLKYINPVLLKTLGYSEDEVVSGKVRWDNLTPPEYAAADAWAVEQLRAHGRCDVYEKVYLAKDGRRIPILIGASVIDTPEGKAEVAAFITELTPLKKAEEALRAANDELEKKVLERTAALEAEIVERKRVEISLRELSGRLLRMQDEERRHMARELHDHAGQTLVALSMNLHAIEMACDPEDGPVRKLASEAKQLSDDLSTEIRTLSYLLHPPLLDEIGLESAIRWFVEGFSERSHIKVDLNLPEDSARLPRDLELVIFRVVQESLTNVHRHSGSSSAAIHVSRSPDRVAVEISDRGKGISVEKQRDLSNAKAGVGVRGMEERVRQFGGTLHIASSPLGTAVVASFPVTAGPS